jgi:uncharacterized protein
MSKIARLVCAGIVLWISAVPVTQAASLGLKGRPSHNDQAGSVRRVMALAQRGDAHAQAVLGFMFEAGRGVPQSYDAAVDWYALSAEQGDPTGQYLLGLLYDKGFGVPQNVILAYKWLNLAAAHAPGPHRENILRLREAVATKMTRVQLDVAQHLSLDFRPIRR